MERPKLGSKAQGGAGFMIGLMVLIIIGVAAVVPVTLDVIANSTATGTTRTILNLLPLMIALLLLIAITAGFALGRR